MKSATRTILLCFLAGGVAFAAGYAARHVSATEGGASETPLVANGVTQSENMARFGKSWSAALAEADPVKRTESTLALLATADLAAVRRLAVRHADDPDVLALILHRWASLDPRGAASWVEDALRDGKLQYTAFDPLIDAWAGRDTDGLTGWLKQPSHTHLRIQHRSMEKLTGALFARDPAAAMALAKEFPETWRLPPEAMSWITKDPAAAARMLGDLPLNNYSEALAGKAAMAWAEMDPVAAAAWAAQLESTRGRATNAIMNSVLESWAKKDPSAAAAFLAAQPHGRQYGGGMVREWARQDGGAALEWILSKTHPAERGRLMSEAASAAAKNDVQATAAFVAQMPDDGLRDEAAAALAAAWAGKDPAGALAWSAQLPPGPGRNDALSRTAAAWAKQDSAAAAVWAKAAPEGSLPPQVYSNIMGSLSNDRDAAWAWLNELPESAGDRASEVFLRGYRQEDVAAALGLPDGKYKPRIVERIATEFLQYRPDQALAWAVSLPAGSDRELVRHALEAALTVTNPTLRNALTEVKKQEMLQRLNTAGGK